MQSRRPLDAKALAIMVALCAIIGTQQVAIKLAAQDMAPIFLVGIRSGLAAIALLVIIGLRNEGRALFSANAWPGALAGALFGIEFLLFAEGLRFTSAAHMAIFLYTGPIFAALCLHLRFVEERLIGLQWLGIGTAFVGIVLAFSGRIEANSHDLTWLGDLYGLAAGVAFGATTLVIRASRLSTAPAAVTLWYQLMGGFIVATAGAVILGQTQVSVTPALIMNLAYQSLIISTLAYIIWFSMLRTYLVSRIGLLSLMTPMFGIAFGWLMLNEALTLHFLAGAALVVMGIVLVSGRERRSEQGKNEA